MMITHAPISEFISKQDMLLPKRRRSSSNKMIMEEKEQCRNSNLNKVQFDDTLVIHLVLRLKDYTKKERKNCFRTEKDAAKMNNKLRGVVRGTTKLKHVRGLEKLTDFGSERGIATKLCIQSVLVEQYRQRNDKTIINDEAIADASRQRSAKSCILALMLAECDERDAFQTYKKMNKSNETNEPSCLPTTVVKRQSSASRSTMLKRNSASSNSNKTKKSGKKTARRQSSDGIRLRRLDSSDKDKKAGRRKRSSISKSPKTSSPSNRKSPDKKKQKNDILRQRLTKQESNKKSSRRNSKTDCKNSSKNASSKHRLSSLLPEIDFNNF